MKLFATTTLVVLTRALSAASLSEEEFPTNVFVKDLLGLPEAAPFDVNAFLGPNGRIDLPFLLETLSSFDFPIPFLSDDVGSDIPKPELFPTSPEELVRDVESSMCSMVVGTGASIGLRKAPLPYYCNVVSTRELKDIRVVNGSEPFVWAEAGATFAELADTLFDQGFETIDEPIYADVSVGAAVVVKAHGGHHSETFIDTVEQVVVVKDGENVTLETPDEIRSLVPGPNTIVLRAKIRVQPRRLYRLEHEAYPVSTWPEVIDDLAGSLITDWFTESGEIHALRKYEATPDDRMHQMRYIDNFVGWIVSQLGGHSAQGPYFEQFAITKNNGWLWPTATYIDQIQRLTTPYNPEVMLPYKMLPVEKLTAFISEYENTSRIYFRRQGDMVWVDVVTSSAKDLAAYFRVFDGLPFYLHEGKVMPPNISYKSYADVVQGEETRPTVPSSEYQETGSNTARNEHVDACLCDGDTGHDHGSHDHDGHDKGSDSYTSTGSDDSTESDASTGSDVSTENDISTESDDSGSSSISYFVAIAFSTITTFAAMTSL